jgi:hypothetical protein
MTRRVAVVAVAVLALAGGAAQSEATVSPGAGAQCPVTIPNGDHPPEWVGSDRIHGNGKLWTFLEPDGIERWDPADKGADGTYFNKYGWLTHVEGRLTVTGRRLDGPAPPLRIQVNGPGWWSHLAAQPYSFFAATWWTTMGCWEITGKVGNTSLTVIRIETDGTSWPSG